MNRCTSVIYIKSKSALHTEHIALRGAISLPLFQLGESFSTSSSSRWPRHPHFFRPNYNYIEYNIISLLRMQAVQLFVVIVLVTIANAYATTGTTLYSASVSSLIVTGSSGTKTSGHRLRHV